MAGRPTRVLVLGDPYFTADDFRPALSTLDSQVEFTYRQIGTTDVPEPRTDSERGLREYAGDPADVTALVGGHDVLVVHGAPVSAETLATPGLRLVCCARGGPVNVDVGAATAYGVPVCGAPGKNAEAVADLTIAFLLLLIRRVTAASRDLATAAPGPASPFDGRAWFGAEAAGTVLGLVGYGAVGRQVARRAEALGCTVLAHDPYTEPDGAESVPLADLLARSDVVSLHARATKGAPPLMGADEFAAMRPGAGFINTAREQLVDEDALLRALAEGHLAGAALDVIETSDARNPLLDLPQVLVTPHIGGATRETLHRGATMAAASIAALLAGEVPPYLVNPQALEAVR